MFLRKQKELILSKIGRLGVTCLIFSIAFSLIATIWSLYIDSFVNNASYVGYISAFLTFVSFMSFFLIIPLIEKTDKAKIFSFSLILFAVLYILFAINTKFYVFIILAFIMTILQTLRITSFGIIVKDKSSEKQLSRNEGIMYTFMNAAWVVGPLVAGYLSGKYGVSLVFILASVFIFIAFIFFKFLKIKDKSVKKKVDKNFFKNFKEFFKSRDRRLAYILGGGVNLWWSLIFVFMPLFIIRNNLDVKWVGYFLFAVVVPLISFQYYFSKLAGKVGFKKIFKIGFFIPCFFVLLCFLVGNIYLIFLFLILASIGLAMVEATTEAYFFDILKGKQDLRFYAPYNTAIDVNHFIGEILAATILVFLPFKFIFLLYSIFMFALFLVSFKVRNIIESKRDGKKNR